MSDPTPQREAVIIGYGFEYLVMALNCARSIRETNPDLLTTLITNLPVTDHMIGDRFDRVIRRDEGTERNRFVKTAVLDYTVARKVVYLDADSEVLGDLTPAFRMLDRFDVLLKLHSEPSTLRFELAREISSQLFPHMSGAAAFFKDDRPARQFLALWQQRMVESGLDRDQPALARTVFDVAGQGILALNATWSASAWERENLVTPKHEPVRILHYGHPHLDPAVARNLDQEFHRVVAVMPEELRATAEVHRVRKKLRLVKHPLFRWRLSRRGVLSLRYRWSRLTGDQEGLPRYTDRGSRAIGRPYRRDLGRLWTDESESWH